MFDVNRLSLIHILSKLLHKHLGIPFYDLLNSVRVQKAKELLENPALRISEIAEQVGYADTCLLYTSSVGSWNGFNTGI